MDRARRTYARDGVNISGLYFKEINKFKILSAEEERRLAARAEMGDAESFQGLIKSHLRLTASQAGRFSRKSLGKFFGLDLLDIIQDANVALILKVRKFDYRRNCRLANYAFNSVLGSIRKSVADQLQLVHISRDKRKAKELVRLKAAARKLEAILRRKPNIYEIAEETKMSIERALEIDKMLRICWLFMPHRDRIVGLRSMPETFVSAHRNILSEDIRSVLRQTLTRRELEVAELRYGLRDGVTRTMEEVGRELGVSRSAIYLVEKSFKEKLRLNPKMIAFDADLEQS